MVLFAMCLVKSNGYIILLIQCYVLIPWYVCAVQSMCLQSI